eukprot:CAMPEP_0113945670 /NCGR_PEP_ID=MMETSP1339-20121228/49340_1 /TAXON_ID=94617 /ORGANISM="Fibrocapsa japonica" /LENGTH=631 /DNA_ID=CAMNT_0000951355 /DNA_START=5 /DNA_END=1900 /DNA_ORIENTATION=+ /assembly_acc=CAM_ASM_000762
MCGIVAILLANQDAAVNQEIYDALTILQHRGQDAAGMVTSDRRRRLHLHKDQGFVRDVFKLQQVMKLLGSYGIGHCRYPTAGAQSDVQEAQPFVTNIPFGLCLAHNGNITNTAEVATELSFRYHCNTDSDSELMLSLIADQLLNQSHSPEADPLGPSHFFTAIRGLMSRVRGGYAGVLLINGYGIVAFRDPCGIRPLSYGCKDVGNGLKDWIAASESVAIESLGYTNLGDVLPGEAVFFPSTPGAPISREMCHSAPKLAPCIFEYVYFGRPDSVFDGVSVYRSRQLMGSYLADKVRKQIGVDVIDVVCPVPDTSRISALQCALSLGVPYEEGLTKNRYIARTFIMPGQKKRAKNVRKKLNPISEVFQGKRVLLVDDSIVRGTTSKQIVSMARDAGASKVFFCSASPEIRFPNVYGIDMPVQSELVAFDKSNEEVAKAIGADAVIYQDLEDMIKSVVELNPDIKQFDTSCFTGEYVTGGIDEAYFQALREARSDRALAKKNMTVASGPTQDIDDLPSVPSANKAACPAVPVAAASGGVPEPSLRVVPAAGGLVAIKDQPQQQSDAPDSSPVDQLATQLSAVSIPEDSEGQAPNGTTPDAAKPKRGRRIGGTSGEHVTSADFRQLQDRLSGWI